eukprot:Seg1828.8 transcript_id=Seg1828.8/GoldUCD/mRNA.D3Y31 product="5-hydroxytryptamine receptor 2C" protein_id=Seg1828.8/GoldUCD/D3Y31
MKNLNDTDTIIICIIYIIFGMIGSIGNISLFLAISTSRVHRRQFSGLFVLNLAISDFLVCLFAAPYYVFSLLWDHDLDHGKSSDQSQYNSICKLPMFLNYFTGTLRILSLAAMSIDRFIAINHPYFYARHCVYDTATKTWLLSFAYLWTQAFVLVLPAMISDKMVVFFGSNGRLCGIRWTGDISFVYVMSQIIFNFIIPSIIIVFTNCKVFWVARKHMAKHRFGNESSSRRKRFLKRFRKRFSSNTHMSKLSTSSSRLTGITCSSFVITEYNDRPRGSLPVLQDSSINPAENQKRLSIPTRKLGISQKTTRSASLAADFLTTQTEDISEPTKRVPITRNLSEERKIISIQELRRSMKAEKVNSRIFSKQHERPSIVHIEDAEKIERVQTPRPSDFIPNNSNSNNNNNNNNNNTNIDDEEHSHWSTVGRVFEGHEDLAHNVIPRERKFNLIAKDWDISSPLDLMQKREKATTSSTRTKTDRTSTSFEIALSTLSLVVCYFISFLPFIIYRLLRSTTDSELSLQVIAYTALLTTLDSAINPYIVLKTRREFRRIIKRKIFCKNAVESDFVKQSKSR